VIAAVVAVVYVKGNALAGIAIVIEVIAAVVVVDVHVVVVIPVGTPVRGRSAGEVKPEAAVLEAQIAAVESGATDPEKVVAAEAAVKAALRDDDAAGSTVIVGSRAALKMRGVVAEAVAEVARRAICRLGWG